MLLNDRLFLGEIDAERLVAGDIALDPLNVGAELLQRRVRFLRGLSQRLPLRAADRRQLAGPSATRSFKPLNYSGAGDNHGYRRLPMKMSPLCPMIDLRGRRKDQRNGETSAHLEDADL